MALHQKKLSSRFHRLEKKIAIQGLGCRIGSVYWLLGKSKKLANSYGVIEFKKSMTMQFKNCDLK